jgi:hypothetical protein
LKSKYTTHPMLRVLAHYPPYATGPCILHITHPILRVLAHYPPYTTCPSTLPTLYYGSLHTTHHMLRVLVLAPVRTQAADNTPSGFKNTATLPHPRHSTLPVRRRDGHTCLTIRA